MCERLLRLKHFINLLGNRGTIPMGHRLTAPQWTIVENVVQLLQPFMLAQKLLEGEKYVTLSLVPPIINKIRSGLLQSTVNAEYSEFIKAKARDMLADFNLRWGSGEPGTVYDEWLTEGPNRRRKGLSTTTLLAFALDPIFKHLP